MESGPTPPRVQNAVHPAQALGEGGNEHGMGHGPWVRGPLALAAHSAGHDPPTSPFPFTPDMSLAIEFLDAARRRACYDARPRSSMGSPVPWTSSSPPAALLQEIERQRGPLLD